RECSRGNFGAQARLEKNQQPRRDHLGCKAKRNLENDPCERDAEAHRGKHHPAPQGRRIARTMFDSAGVHPAECRARTARRKLRARMPCRLRLTEPPRTSASRSVAAMPVASYKAA